MYHESFETYVPSIAEPNHLASRAAVWRRGPKTGGAGTVGIVVILVIVVAIIFAVPIGQPRSSSSRYFFDVALGIYLGTPGMLQRCEAGLWHLSCRTWTWRLRIIKNR